MKKDQFPRMSTPSRKAENLNLPLEEKKRRIIQDIRTLLNDYPTLHPLADDVFVSSTLTLLKRIHLELMQIDGSVKRREAKIRERLEKNKKMASAPLRALKKSPPKKDPRQEELEISLDL